MGFIKRTATTKTGRAAAFTLALSAALVLVNKGGDFAKTFDLSESGNQRVDIVKTGLIDILNIGLAGGSISSFVFRGISKKGFVDTDPEEQSALAEGKRVLATFGTFENMQQELNRKDIEKAQIRAEAALQQGRAEQASSMLSTMQTNPQPMISESSTGQIDVSREDQIMSELIEAGQAI